MESIRTRILKSYISMAMVILIMAEILAFIGVKKYYYESIKDTLLKQAQISSNIYLKYSYKMDLKQNASTFIYSFSNLSQAQVQIIDRDKTIIEDSVSQTKGKKINSIDVEKALNDKSGVYIGKTFYSDEKIMAVSFPLKYNKNIIGVVRFITSLETVDKYIYKIYFILILVGIVIIAITIILSIVVSNGITAPIKDLTKAARNIAKGDLKIKAPKKYNDEIGELADTINYMTGEILKNENMKNEFISSISHELRTPLTSIKGWIITLKTGDLENKEELEDGFNIIEKETDRLSSLLEELLDFSRLLQGRISLYKSDINIVDFLQMTYKQMIPRAKRLDIDFQLQMDSDIETTMKINLDERRMKQVFINVLDNAFKFTEKGSKVIIKLQQEEDNIIFKVIDNGIGIKENEIGKVKNKFYKGSNSASGNGIGLSICDEIIELHKGKFNIESEYGKGTIITIKIPKGKGGDGNC